MDQISGTQGQQPVSVKVDLVWSAAHDGAASDPAHHLPALLELPVGGLDGPAIDRQRKGKLSRCRQAVARGQETCRDSCLQGRRKLLRQRLAGGSIQNDARPAQLA